MNPLLQLKQEKAAALDLATAILTKLQTEKRSAMTAEERASFEQHKAKAEEIQQTIEAHEQLASMTNIPTDQVAGRGRIEVRDNTLTNIPTDQVAGRGRIEVRDNTLSPFVPEPRQNETKEENRARLSYGFGLQLKAVMNSVNSGVKDARLEEIQQRAAAAGLSEAVPADGGFLIAPEFQSEILKITHEVGLIYTRTRKIPLDPSTNAIKIPGIDEQSRADGSRWGGVRMFWENEADALTGSKPKFRLIELVTKKLTGLFYSTNELLNDAAALGAVVMQAFGEEFAFKLDDGVFRGTGSGQLMGILNAPALVTVNKETGQATQTIVYENIKKMWGRMWARSRANAVWFINQDLEQQLLGLIQVVGTAGAPVVNTGGAPQYPVYVPPGVNGAANGTLYGRPVIVVEQCDTLGTSGDIIFADLSQYVMVDKGGMQAAVSMHVRFLTDEMTYRWIYRADGQSLWHTALTPFKGSNTLSPFIALQSR